ncbi:MAG: hypothetical protein LUH15_19715 [Tannerellaceae bacterium]|nr:hypothetical protein [Tannerellaceae bacterium]
MRSTYTQHIRTHLSSFLREEDERFANIFEKIPLADEGKYKTLLVYVHKLLDHVFKETDTDLTTLHLHFEREPDTDCKKRLPNT